MSNHNLNQMIDGSPRNDEDDPLPPSYLVLRIAPDIPNVTVSWLISKIKGHKRDGGAELIVMRQPISADKSLVFHLSAAKYKFLEVAEEIEIVKEDKNKQMREFLVCQLEDFLHGGMSVDDLFTMAEKQTIIKHELEQIRALTEDTHIPGFPTCKLYENQNIFQFCLRKNIITKVYPLHDDEAVKKLDGLRLPLFLKQKCIEDIRLYFGESIALYFAFLGFYTMSLLVPLVFSLLGLLISSDLVPFFCVFNVIWVTVVLEVWKRKNSELAFKWGTIGMTSFDEPRANFQGAMGKDSVTGRETPQYPRYFTNLKMYLVSFPIVLICMFGAFLVMLLSFWLEEFARNLEPPYDTLSPFPSVVYAILVHVINSNYRKLANFLTEWENHRTQSQFDRHRVTKLVLFEFVNNFMSLFWIAFVKKDQEMLRNQLQTMLIIYQGINNFQEAILPLALRYFKSKMTQVKKIFYEKSPSHKKNQKRILGAGDQHENVLHSIPVLEMDDPRIEAAEKEDQMDIYESTYDDYLELFIQFGYVFLFSPVYPMAAFWAFLNNIIEIRADAFKLCKLCQRPLTRRVKDIGAWQQAFEVIGALSILTNCGILWLSPNLRKKGQHLTSLQWFMWFVLLEHVLLLVRYLFHITISDKPEWVRVALAKRNYESKQALKNERAQKSRKILTRRFRSFHVDSYGQ